MDITFAAAKRLCSQDKHSGLIIGVFPYHVILPWSCLQNLREAIRVKLERALKLYNSQLSGIPVAYGKVIMTPTAMIYEDQPTLQLNLRVEFAIFRPDVGSILKGIVSRVLPGSVHLLVLNCFNATLWLRASADNATMPKVKPQENWVLFRVTRIDTHNKLISLDGHYIKLVPGPKVASKLPDIVDSVPEKVRSAADALTDTEHAAQQHGSMNALSKQQSPTATPTKNTKGSHTDDGSLAEQSTSNMPHQLQTQRMTQPNLSLDRISTTSTNDHDDITVIKEKKSKKRKHASTTAAVTPTDTADIVVKQEIESSASGGEGTHSSRKKRVKNKNTNINQDGDVKSEEPETDVDGRADTRALVGESSAKKKKKKKHRNETEEDVGGTVEIKEECDEPSGEVIDATPKMSRKRKHKHDKDESARKRPKGSD